MTIPDPPRTPGHTSSPPSVPSNPTKSGKTATATADDTEEDTSNLAKKVLHDGAAEPHRNPLLDDYQPYMIPSDQSLHDVRRRLSTAIRQTRELRLLFTNRVQDKFHIPLPPVPGLEDILQQCRAPGASDRLKWEMSFISSNSGSSKRHPESRLLKSLLLAGHNIPTTGAVSMGSGAGSGSGGEKPQLTVHHVVQGSTISSKHSHSVVGDGEQVDDQSMKRRALHLMQQQQEQQSSSITANGKSAIKRSLSDIGKASNIRDTGLINQAEAVIFKQYPTLKRMKRTHAVAVMKTEDVMTDRARESIRQISNFMITKTQMTDNEDRNAYDLEYHVLKDETVFQELSKLSTQGVKATKAVINESSKTQIPEKKNNDLATKQIDPMLSFSVLFALGLITRPSSSNSSNQPLSHAIRSELKRDNDSTKPLSFLSNFVEPQPKKVKIKPSEEQPPKELVTISQSTTFALNKAETDDNASDVGSKSKDSKNSKTKPNENIKDGYNVEAQVVQEKDKEHQEQSCAHIPKNHATDTTQQQLQKRQQPQQQQNLHPLQPLQTSVVSNYNITNSYSNRRDHRAATYNSIHQRPDLQSTNQNYTPQHMQIPQQNDQYSSSSAMARQQLSRASSNQSQNPLHHQAFQAQNSIQIANHYVVNRTRSHSTWNQNSPQPNMTIQNSYDMGYSNMYNGQSNSQIYHQSHQYCGNNFTSHVGYAPHVRRQMEHVPSAMPYPAFNGNGRRHSAVRVNEIYDSGSVTVAQAPFHQQQPQPIFYSKQVTHNSMQCPHQVSDLSNGQQHFPTGTCGDGSSIAPFEAHTSPPKSQVKTQFVSIHKSNILNPSHSDKNHYNSETNKNNSLKGDTKQAKSIPVNDSLSERVLKFDAPKPAPGLSAESATLVLRARFHEVKPNEKSIAFEYLLTLLKAIPIPCSLILKPLRDKIPKSTVSKDAIASVALLWLWKEHRDSFEVVYQKGLSFEKDIECRRLINMVIESCVRIVNEAERLKRFGTTGDQFAASLVSEGLESTLFVSRQSDEILPRINKYVSIVDRLREKVLRLQCQEKVYLANLIARQTCMSETFSDVYVDFIVKSGEILGHEDLAELVQDEEFLVSSLFVHDVILNGVGKAWEDPGRPTLGFTPGLNSKDLIQRAHARAQLQRSLFTYQRAHNIGGGTSCAGVYGDGSCPTTSMLAPAIRGIQTKVELVDVDMNALPNPMMYPAHNCAPLELDHFSMKDTPYGSHDSSYLMEAYRRPLDLSPCATDSLPIFSCSNNLLSTQDDRSKAQDERAEMKPNPSTQPIEWEDVTSQFISVTFNDLNQISPGVSSPKQATTEAKQTCESLSPCIFSPSVKVLERNEIEVLLNDTESDITEQEDISDAAIIGRHQVVLDDMKEKLNRLVEARKNRYTGRVVPSH